MILDTNALFAFIEGSSPLGAVLNKPGEIVMAVIVLGEFRYGIRQSRYRAQYEQWLAEYLPHYRVLTVDEETANRYAAIRSELRNAGTPIPSNDVWIASLCRQHSLPLVSRDRHFDQVKGLRRVDW